MNWNWKFWESTADSKPKVIQFIAGEDRRFTKKALDSTGAFFLDPDNLLGYFCMTGGMRRYIIRDSSGRVKTKGQVGLIFELSAQPWNFNTNTWESDVTQDDIIMSNALDDGLSNADKQIEKQKTYEGLLPVLMILGSIIGLIVVIMAIANWDKISGSLV
ncbi:MAG: hypothetical protein PHV74_06735 [Dehalococcoidia bacterium]|nr:hypothetical protein [Dehalococcoidia bacterium]